MYLPVLPEKHFSQIWDLGGKTANNINSHYRKNSKTKKINDQHFGPFFQFLRKKNSPEKWLCHTQPHMDF